MSTEQRSAVGQNVISLPKGGGAIAGLGETFSPDLFTGTGNFSVPIAVPPGRNGLQPSLTLGYSTGNGNGPFGLGWSLALPGITRKTSLGIPRYADDRDVFVLSGAEDLIPVDRGHGTTGGIVHTWIQYRPRTEGLFARIIHHTFSDGQDYWEVRTKDGLVTWYGKPGAHAADNTVVHNPEDPRRIATWMIHRTADPFGSEVVYEYERDLQRTPYAWTQLYLTRIRYVDYTHESVKRYLCSVELAYADRPDPHSEFRQGFEIRTTRRCTAIRTYTHPLDANMPQGHPPSGTNTNTVAVKTYHLTYRDELGQQALNRVSLLADVRVEGHDAAASESLPPVEFEYTDFDIARRSLTTVNGAHLPALGLAHPDMDLVDLDGNGLPDLVQLSAGQPIRYWKNRGNGTFDRVRTMRNAPSGLALGSGAVQLMDADGDGRVDLVMNAPDFAGYYALDHNGEWDVDSFRPYATRPPLDLQSAQAQFIDLSGDGRTDVLINADRFICYFQNAPLLDVNRNFDGLQAERRAVGWSEARFVSKAGSDDFPNVNFGDPRIRTADLSGDGLQDIVQIENGRICYWPNLGYGRFGKRRVMRNSPRPGRDIDPAQLILGDADGDGLTDVILVEHDRITVWINQSGNGFSDPITIHGTPAFTRRDSVRPVDLLGTGTPGLLWSYALGDARDRFAYLDLTGGAKPYVMVGMRNNLGARTRVQYGSSVQHYLRDTYGRPTASDQQGDFTGYAGPWKTTLPFPVQVVDRVEVIDEISQGKLTTRYFYHHGYWDGAEREFRGFGRVDQFDTETFERYHTDDLILDAALTGVSVEHYAPPVLAKNWFHLGPVGAANGDWSELDLHSEYWSGDADMLARDPDMLAMIQGLPRRARRDAYRTLRGTALRSELYAMDGSPLQQRPYTVSETQTGLRLVDGPATNATIRALAVETHSNCIFFSYGLGSRSTTWERGGDPMTKCSFTGAIDAYGQPLSQVSIAVPRGKDPRTGGELTAHTGTYDPARGYDATVQYTEYIHEDPATGGTKYMVNRVKKAHSYEAVNAGTQGLSVAALRALLLSGPPSGWTGLTHRLLSLAYTYYDGNDHDGLPYGQIGAYGMPVRTKTLVVQPAELTAAFGATHPAPFQGASAPDWSGHPGGFVGELLQPACGYRWHTGGSGPEQFVEGYYTTPQATQYDFQGWPGPHRGLPMVLRDAYGSETVITYDPYQFFPTSVMDPLYMVTYAAYDYRVMQPFGVLDPNENATFFAFTPLGLMHKTALMGKFAAPEGDTLAVPGVLLEYDLFAFMRRGEPVWVKTTQREHHVNAPYSGTMPPDEFNATIVAVEYSDGFGRQLQTRTQAEDVLFGTPDPVTGVLLGDSGLPADQDAPDSSAVATRRAPGAPLNVVVSGTKRYNNKGKVVELWEPRFGSGFTLTDPTAQQGQRLRLFYDALGRPQRTVNPDGTQQRVVYGVPDALDTPDAFAPSPWERYSYDALDLAPITHPSTPPAPSDFTPKSEVIDALGRTVRTTEHKAHPDTTVTPTVYEDVVMRYAYDIQGRLLTVTDPLDRVNFQHLYDTAGNTLWTQHLDSGVRTAVVDAQGKPLYDTDAKGARSYTSYDRLSRPTGLWARDLWAEPFTRRETLIYGDQAGTATPAAQNLMGRLYLHYDEAGKTQVAGYDFKGNPLERTRWTIKDDILLMPLKHVVDWTPLDESILDPAAYTTNLAYDALNRVRAALYPADVNSHRTMAIPTYNRAGALQRVTLDGIPYVWQIAYNAKGQRLLLTMANGVMTRYTYDPLTFRLLRIRSEKFDPASPDHPLIPNGGVQQDLGYQYDLGGNIIGIRDTAPANGSAQGPGDLLKQFVYDPLKRLLSATGRESTAPSALPQWDANVRGHDHTATNTYTRAYTYDQVGNVLKEQHTADGHPANSFTKTFTYHPTNAHNRLVDYRVGGYTFDLLYDANGNLVQEINSRHHQWGHADQLKYFMVRAGSSGPPSVYTHYLYGASGDRVKKVVNKPASGGGVLQEVTIYIDGVFEETYVRPLAADIDPDRHYNTLHVMDGRSRIATLRVGTDVDDPTPPTKFNLEDHLGTSTVMLDFSGNLVNREEYYPFGETCFGAFAKKRYRYVGKEKDNESGLYYYGARYYAPWTCRFISVDPLADKYPMLSPYNYASNSPIGQLDIDGMQNPEQPTAPSGGGNAEFDKVASAFAEEHRGGSCAIQTYSDGNTFLGMLASDTETIFYDSRQPAKFAMHTGNFDGSASVDENAMKWQVAVHYIDSNERLHPGYADPFERYAVPLIEGTKGEVAMVGFFTYLATRNGVTMGAPDSTTTPDVLFDEWVFGGGSDVHVFDEQSTMGQGMLETNYVQEGMQAAAAQAQAGDFNPFPIERNAGAENELAYAITTIYEGTIGNAVRAFHGSIRGTVSVTDLFEVEGQQYAMMRVVLWDRMGAESGTRYPPILNGYSGEGPRSVLPNEPFATDGMFRTKLVYYDMNVLYPIPK